MATAKREGTGVADIAGFRRAAVLGTGQMGPGIAMLLAHGGLDTVLVSRTATGAERGLQEARALLQFWQERDITGAAAVRATLAHLTATSDRATAVADADVVVESIVEDLAIKQALFAAVEREARPDALLCTNTSGLRISDIAVGMQRPQRAYTTHFWNPPHLVPLVEIIVGEHSDPAGAERLRALLRACGKRPVVGLKDVPGQLANRLQHAVIREALYMLEQGVASAEDIEESLKAGPGIRWPVYGPFEHNDMVGLELTRAVQAAVIPSLAANVTPATLLDTKIAAGELGVKSGQGHYRWTPEQAAAVRRRRDEFLVERLRAERQATGD
jgi:3-hydroxybutyryl-CoA dehydrogenase